MDLSFIWNAQDMKHPVWPWIMFIFAIVYVMALSFYAQNQGPANPSYNFYDSTAVEIKAYGLSELPESFGQFNNILEGKRQIVAAELKDSSTQELVFSVNSPRPAVIYLNEEALDVVLIPGDTSLKIEAFFSEEEQLDSVRFLGRSAGIAEYYQEKKRKLNRQNIRGRQHVVLTDDFKTYAKAVDSMTAAELVFLVEKEVFTTLPNWFVQLEKNEALYQKAYLKLSAAYNNDVDSSLLDMININNEGAVFSYYYYLYLNAYFSHLQSVELSSTSYEEVLSQQLALADSLLYGEPHDVFISRVIFQQLAMGNKPLAKELFKTYQNRFNSQKYKRYLKMEMSQQ
ncbi:MAG: hypothetical protein AAFY71_26610 [Bacteroidota bacterium]